MILSLFLLFTTSFAQQTPFEQLIRQVILQTNKLILENHQDVLEIAGFKYNDIVNLEVGKFSTRNFSTISLKGSPDVKQVVNEDGTSFYFDMSVGLEVLNLEIDYKFSFSFFSSSGPVILKNSGNALRMRGVVNTFNGNQNPCNSAIQAVEIDSLGSLDVELGKKGVINWILGGLMKFAYGIGESYVRTTINQMIADKVQATEFQAIFSKLACSPFNI